VADGANSPIASTLIQNCPTKIYLADPEALNNQDAYRKFGLTAEEVQMLSLSRKKQDYYYKSPSGTRLFQLSLGPLTLALMRQQDQMVKTPKGDTVRWNDYCRYLLDLKKNREIQKGFVEEILDIQGIRYKNYLKGTLVDERAEEKEAV
jgi:type IV secretion system protein VirB4